MIISIKPAMLSLFTGILSLLATSTSAQLPAGYKGLPYKDSVYTGVKLNSLGAQMLPGRVELAYYDLGGEGVAYHDNTKGNEGARLHKKPGALRPGISDNLAFFRDKDGVDINYTQDRADFGHPNKVDPAVNQLYICNQEKGEWANYTIYVNQKGNYVIYTVYSNTAASPVELWVNNRFAGNLVFPQITGDPHQWTQSEVGSLSFPEKGYYLLTVRFSKGINLGYLDFLYNEARQQ